MGRTVLLHGGGDGGEAADTELSLRTGGNSSRTSSVPPPPPQAFRSPAPSPRSPLGPHQPMTIFYGGRICVCDVTEVQARSIIAAAQRGTTTAAEEKGELDQEEQVGDGVVLPRPADHVAAAPPQQQLGPGLSMKASLQRFLQKRKSRAAVDPGTPYARPHGHLRPRHGRLPQQLQLQRLESFFL